MIFRSDVNKSNQVTWWNILIAAVLLIGGFILLFPRDLMVQKLMDNPTPTEASMLFVKNLVAKDPTNVALKISLAKQMLQLGKVKEMKALLAPLVTTTPITQTQWKILWFYYQANRIEAFELSKKNPERLKKEAVLKTLLPLLAKSHFLTADEAGFLAEDALAFNLPAVSVTFFSMAVELHIKKPASFYGKAAMAALFGKAYETSSRFALIAMQKSRTIEEKRKYFIQGANSLLAQGTPEKAFVFVQKNSDGLQEDKASLLYMASLAMQARQQQQAEIYISKVLQLQYLE